jgi:hypothetical protein
MRLRRSRRRNLILLSSRDVSPHGIGPIARSGRRRRFRILRTGALLTVMGAVRLAQLARYRWRLSVGLAGVLLEVVGHSALTGPARGAADLLGLAIILVAVLKSGDPAASRRPGLPQTAWRWPG